MRKIFNRTKKEAKVIDMLNGPLLKNLFAFAIPVILSGILQLLYNSADMIVVGRFVGKQSLAAVGSTGSITGLIVSALLTLSSGASVALSIHIGARENKKIHEIIHTAILSSAIIGIVLMIIGLFVTPTLLRMLETPIEIFDLAEKYLFVIFCGTPAVMIYNFGASIMRAYGDTKRPVYFLLISGATNLILNIIFVVVFFLDVVGVALATVISQYLSAFFVLRCLARNDNTYALVFSKLKIYKDRLYEILKIGLPMSAHTLMLTISNVFMSKAYNSLGADVLAGKTAAGSLASYINLAMSGIVAAAIAFAGQNMGAKNYKKIRKILYTCLLINFIIGLTVGYGVYFFGKPLISLYNEDPMVIAEGMVYLAVYARLYFLSPIMDMPVVVLRGMGYSTIPTIISVFGVCLLNIAWVYTIFAWFPQPFVLYLAGPASWIATGVPSLVAFEIIYKRLMRKKEDTIQEACV